jgi:hypothetical protein
VQQRALTGDLARFAQVVGGNEQAHVDALKNRLGSKARSQPTYNFRGATADPQKFARAAHTLEEIGVGAYIGQGGNLTKDAARFVAGITSVEARHAGWIRDILHRVPAPHTADPAMSQHDVTAAVKRTGFV